MGTSKHTPGPWAMETVRTSCGLCHRVGPFPSPKSWKADKPAHACIYDDYPPTGGSPELVANARLIAAAPDMLAALKALLQANDDVQTALCDGPDVPGWDRTALPRAQANVTAAEAVAKAAIAKAEGRS